MKYGGSYGFNPKSLGCFWNVVAIIVWSVQNTAFHEIHDFRVVVAFRSKPASARALRRRAIFK